MPPTRVLPTRVLPTLPTCLPDDTVITRAGLVKCASDRPPGTYPFEVLMSWQRGLLTSGRVVVFAIKNGSQRAPRRRRNAPRGPQEAQAGSREHDAPKQPERRVISCGASVGDLSGPRDSASRPNRLGWVQARTRGASFFYCCAPGHIKVLCPRPQPFLLSPLWLRMPGSRKAE